MMEVWKRNVVPGQTCGDASLEASTVANSGALSRWEIKQRHSKGMAVGRHDMVVKQSQNQQEPQAPSTVTQGRSRFISRSAAHQGYSIINELSWLDSSIM